MANTGRYTYCPAAGKIRRNPPTIRERIRKWLKRRRENPSGLYIVDYWPPIK